jgi:hypothetical protein
MQRTYQNYQDSETFKEDEYSDTQKQEDKYS